jgi:biotin carboxyl carrier protein
MPYLVSSEHLSHPVEATLESTTVTLSTGETFAFTISPDGALIYALQDDKRVPIVATLDGHNTVKLSIGGYTYSVDVLSERDQYFQQLLRVTATSASGSMKVVTPMPGLLKAAMVQNGQRVKKGERLFILEAMKMENDIKSPADGIITGLTASTGTAVEKGFLLCSVEPPDESNP